MKMKRRVLRVGGRRWKEVAFTHEDWEAQGFYIYELNLSGKVSLAEPILHAVRQVCPIESAEEIEGRAAVGGIIRPIENPESREQCPRPSIWVPEKPVSPTPWKALPLSLWSSGSRPNFRH